MGGRARIPRIESLCNRPSFPDTAARRNRSISESGNPGFDHSRAHGTRWPRNARAGDWRPSCNSALVMNNILNDLRLATRWLLARPGFSLTAVLTLALCTGITTTIFSVVDGVILRPLPLPDAARLITLCERYPGATADWCSVSPPNAADIAERSHAFSSIGIARSWGAQLQTPEGGVDIASGIADAGFFTAIGVPPLMGRTLRAADLTGTPGQVAVVSYDFWQTRLGGANDAVGHVLSIDKAPVTVVGVMPRAFHAPMLEYVELWRPLHIDPRDEQHRAWAGFVAYARLKPGVSLDAARADLDAIDAGLKRDHFTANPDWWIAPRPLQDLVVGEARGTILLFLGAVGLVLLIGCANVAHSPARARQRAAPRDRDPHRARREPRRSRAAAAHGEHAACHRGHRARRAARDVGHRGVPLARAARRAAPGRGRAQRARAPLRDRARRGHDAPLRAGARARAHARGSGAFTAHRRPGPHHARRRTGPRARDGRTGGGRRAARRRGAARPHLRRVRRLGTGIRPRASPQFLARRFAGRLSHERRCRHALAARRGRIARAARRHRRGLGFRGPALRRARDVGAQPRPAGRRHRRTHRALLRCERRLLRRGRHPARRGARLRRAR